MSKGRGGLNRLSEGRDGLNRLSVRGERHGARSEMTASPGQESVQDLCYCIPCRLISLSHPAVPGGVVGTVCWNAGYFLTSWQETFWALLPLPVQSGHLEHPIRFYPNGFSAVLSLPLLLYKSVRPSVKVECIFRMDSSPGFSMIL